VSLIVIATHDNEGEVVAFRLLDDEDFKYKDVSYDAVYSALKNKEIDIMNAELSGNKIVGTNGSLQRYAVLDGGRLVGKSPLIILYSLGNGGYKVTTYLGEVVDISEEEAINYADTEGIANGKIVTGEKGKRFISSILGTYKTDFLTLDKKSGASMVSRLRAFGIYDIEYDNNFKGKAVNKNAVELTFHRGALGVADRGCSGLKKLKKVILYDTIETLGIEAFSGCIELEDINIPEGVEEIPERCFYNCTSLKSIKLPNSLKRIKSAAFTGCRGLKTIEFSVNLKEIAFGALPSVVTKKVRR